MGHMGPIKARMLALLDEKKPKKAKKPSAPVPAPRGSSGGGDDAHASQIITTGTRGKFW